MAHASGEIGATVSRVRWLADAAEKAAAPYAEGEGGGMVERVVYEPLGVVANVSAWNYPYFVSSNVFAAALATGSAVRLLFKPPPIAVLLRSSSATPGTPLLLTAAGEAPLSLSGLPAPVTALGLCMKL